MFKPAVLALLALSPLIQAAPTEEFGLETRASSCTFKDVASLAKSKKSCTAITLSNIAVPAGETLDLTSLTKGTTVSCPVKLFLFAF